MKKRFLTVLLCLAVLFCFGGCSSAETVGGWLDGVTENMDGIIPNDVERIIAQITGQAMDEEEHVVIFSQGCAKMLESGVFHITYHLEDGTEVEFGSNGARTGSSYPDTSASVSTAVTYDEEGNPVEPEYPQEHIVLKDGIYYYIDDAQSKIFTVNPANYKAVPFEISAEGLAFASSGTESFGGEECRFERYSAEAGDVTFYYRNGTLFGMKVEQGETHILYDVTAFNKYVNPSLVAIPSGYTLVQYWTGE